MCTPFLDLHIQLCSFNLSYLIQNHFQLLVWYGLQTLQIWHKGHVPNPNSRYFGWYIKWNRPFRFGMTGIFRTSFDSGPLWLVWSFRSVGPKCPFPLDKIVVPITALLYPAYKNNNQTHGGLGRVCATRMYHYIVHVKFPKFQTRSFVEWKAPKNTYSHFQFLCQSGINWGFWVTDHLPLP